MKLTPPTPPRGGIEEIKKKYQGEWVLIEYKELDENLIPLEGEVLAHSLKRGSEFTDARSGLSATALS